MELLQLKALLDQLKLELELEVKFELWVDMNCRLELEELELGLGLNMHVGRQCNLICYQLVWLSLTSFVLL